MKKRRSIIALFLLVAVMTIGVGYAGISETLTISGSATTTPEVADIVFSHVQEKDSSIVQKGDTTPDISFTGLNTTTLTLTATGYQAKDDSCTVTVTVTNNNSYAVALGTLSNPNLTNFAVTTTYQPQATLAAGRSYNFDVTITLTAAPSADALTDTLNITIPVTAGTQE